MDLPKILPDELERLSSIALRAVCHAYGSPPLADNAPFDSMLEFARSAVQDPARPWSDMKKQFVHQLRGLGEVQMRAQRQLHMDIAESQQRMAAEAERMAAAEAAVDADGFNEADDADDAYEFAHLSPGI